MCECVCEAPCILSSIKILILLAKSGLWIGFLQSGDILAGPSQELFEDRIVFRLGLGG